MRLSVDPGTSTALRVRRDVDDLFAPEIDENPEGGDSAGLLP